MHAEPDHIALFYRCGTALLIGLLVGLQREYSQLQQKEYEKMFGGVRNLKSIENLFC